MEKNSRSQKQKMVFERMLIPMKDFYDFAWDAYVELGKGKRRERIFRSILSERCRREESREEENREREKELIAKLAEKLAKESCFLLKWCPEEQWNKEWEERFSVEMWKKTLALWCQEDSFPAVYDRYLPCKKRDVVLYVMMVCGFTVEESEELLGELSRRKDRDYVRPLYRLDFKEGFFLWLMRWNEKHPEKPVSFGDACGLYKKYGDALLDWLVSKTEELEHEIQELLSEKNDRELLGFRENYTKLWGKLCKGERKRINLFDETQAEEVKRLLTVVTCAERYVTYEKEANLSGDGRRKRKGADWRQRQFRERNEQTRMNRGTRYVGKKMDRLAEEEDFENAFSVMCRTLKEEMGEAHWRTYSTLIWLYGRSGSENWKNRFLIPFVKPSEKTKVGRRYGSMGIFNEDGRQQSFSLSVESISQLVDSQAANGKMISNLFAPVLRNGNLVSASVSQDSSPMFSDLKNNYQNWQKGEKSPYKYYKRKTVLKFLLAAGVEEPGRLNNLMEMAGSQELDYLDSREGMVYLMAAWRARLKGICDNLLRTVNSLDMGDYDEKLVKQAAELVCSLPPELGVELLGLKSDNRGNVFKVKELLKEEEGIIQDDIFPEVGKWFDTSLIYDLKWMEFLFVCFDADQGTPQETLDKLFYGPCTEKFDVPAWKGRIQWAAFYKALWSLISCGSELIFEPQRLVFENWKNTMESGQTFAIEDSSGMDRNFLDSHETWLERELSGQHREGNGCRTEQGLDWKVEKHMPETTKAVCLERIKRLNEAAEEAVFLCQTPCTWEAEAALELWFYGLALWKLLGLDCESEEYRASRDLLRDRACFWYCTCQLDNFSLKGYRKLFGCDTYRTKEDTEEKSDIISWDRRETDISEADLFTYEKEERQISNTFRMWEKIFHDVTRLRDGMNQLDDKNADLFERLKDAYRKFCAVFQGAVREQWKMAIKEQEQKNPEVEQVKQLKQYYWEVYQNETTKVSADWF